MSRQRGPRRHNAKRLQTSFWHRKRRMPQQTAHFFIKQWKLTQSELASLEYGLRNGGRRGVTPAGKCEWFKDVVEDGDIKRNPGPHSASNKTCKFTSCMVNADGASKTWAFTRWITCQRPVLAVVQEHCMTQVKQADLARYLSKQAQCSSWGISTANQVLQTDGPRFTVLELHVR